MNAMRMEDTCDALGAIMKRMGTGRGQGRGRGRGWGTGEPFPRRLCASRGPPAGQALTKMHLHPGLLTSLLTSLQLLLLPPLPLLLLLPLLLPLLLVRRCSAVAGSKPLSRTNAIRSTPQDVATHARTHARTFL